MIIKCCVKSNVKKFKGLRIFKIKSAIWRYFFSLHKIQVLFSTKMNCYKSMYIPSPPYKIQYIELLLFLFFFFLFQIPSIFFQMKGAFAPPPPPLAQIFYNGQFVNCSNINLSSRFCRKRVMGDLFVLW